MTTKIKIAVAMVMALICAMIMPTVYADEWEMLDQGEALDSNWNLKQEEVPGLEWNDRDGMFYPKDMSDPDYNPNYNPDYPDHDHYPNYDPSDFDYDSNYLDHPDYPNYESTRESSQEVPIPETVIPDLKENNQEDSLEDGPNDLDGPDHDPSFPRYIYVPDQGSNQELTYNQRLGSVASDGWGLGLKEPGSPASDGWGPEGPGSPASPGWGPEGPGSPASDGWGLESNRESTSNQKLEIGCLPGYCEHQGWDNIQEEKERLERIKQSASPDQWEEIVRLYQELLANDVRMEDELQRRNSQLDAMISEMEDRLEKEKMLSSFEYSYFQQGEGGVPDEGYFPEPKKGGPCEIMQFEGDVPPNKEEGHEIIRFEREYDQAPKYDRAPDRREYDQALKSGQGSGAESGHFRVINGQKVYD